MEDRRSVTQAELAGERATTPTSKSPGDWWAAPAAALLVVVCCAGPLLVGVLVASGAGGWLATHGFLLGAAAVMVVAAIHAVGDWIRVKRERSAPQVRDSRRSLRT